MLQCGLFEHEITPELGEDIPGKFLLRTSEGIEDGLYAHAAYFENDAGEKCVVASVDVIFLPDDMADEAREMIAQRLGMDKACIMLAATHSHTAGPVWSWGEFCRASERYIDFLKHRIVDAALLAAQRAQEVTLRVGKGAEARIAYVRDFLMEDGSVATNPLPEHIVRPIDEIDPELLVLYIDRPDGTPVGALVNFACHCDCVNGNRYSSDYPGAMREMLQKVWGTGFVPVFINGFCGNINHCDVVGHSHEAPGHYKRMGRMLAADVLECREWAEAMEEAGLQAAQRVMEMDTRAPDQALIDWARSVGGDAGVIDRFYAAEALRMAETGTHRVRLVVQVMRIGEFALFGMPGEIYTCFAKQLKARARSRYVASANLANGNVGYIPPEDRFLPGIYPARLCSSSKMEPGAGRKMTEELLGLEETLF